MLFFRFARHLLMFALCLPLLASVVGCGGKEEAKAPQIKPGNMPEAGEWSGVYYSPVFGYLHLVKEGTTISGKWRTSAGDKWGELSGEVVGDLLRYQWQEHVIGAVGVSAATNGHGYFRYVVPAATNVDHEIHGEWGLNAEEAGQKWIAIKQRNQKPDPASLMPDETQAATGDGWDETKQEKKPAPEKKQGSSEADDDDWE